MTTVYLNPTYRRMAFWATIVLILLCVVWELMVWPWPQGALITLKVTPLLLPLSGLWRGKLYTMQWVSMLILIYFMEGVVRWYSDTILISRYFAAAEVLLTLLIFYAAIMYVRPAKRLAKERKKRGQ